MYPCFQPFEPEVVRLKLKGATPLELPLAPPPLVRHPKLKGATPLELPLAPPPLVRQNAFCDGILA